MTILTHWLELMPRAIHINTFPAARNLAETRLILAALQKFGEVATFRTLRYDHTNNSPNKIGSTVVLFDTEAAANSALQASPILIPLPNADGEKNLINDDADKRNGSLNTFKPPSQSQSFSYRDRGSRNTNPHQNQDKKPTHLRCSISQSHHNHLSALQRNPFYTQFEAAKTSAIRKDLLDTGIGLTSLADDPGTRKESVGLTAQMKTHLATKKLGGMSLMGLYREGMDERRERGEKVRRGQFGKNEGKKEKVVKG